MDDSKIVDLYWARAENAITETAVKYKKYCYSIAYNILHNIEDADECVNDTYLRAWDSIPPSRPHKLSTYLGKITRNLALNKHQKNNAVKRGGGQTEMVLSELEECIPLPKSVELDIDDMAIAQSINEFLVSLPKINRVVFVQRYWYLDTIEEIARRHVMSDSKVKSMLFRIRNKLRLHLEQEGITL